MGIHSLGMIRSRIMLYTAMVNMSTVTTTTQTTITCEENPLNVLMTGTTGTKGVFAILFRSFTTILMCRTQLIVLRRLFVFTKVRFAITSMDLSTMAKMNATTGMIEPVKLI